MSKDKVSIYILLGISLFAQAVTSLVGGIIGISPFTKNENIDTVMKGIAGNISNIYISIFLQIITSIIIVVLGVALYESSKDVNKTASTIALSFYLMEAVILIVCQMIIFSLVDVSIKFLETGESAFVNIGNILFSSKNFLGSINMIPFGLGAFIFYYLIMKAEIIPKWLGVWGLLAVPLILIGWTFEAFKIKVPFFIYIPYVPWEFVAGIFIFIKSIFIYLNK